MWRVFVGGAGASEGVSPLAFLLLKHSSTMLCHVIRTVLFLCFASAARAPRVERQATEG